MEKNILSEINRNREIMGLGQLLREQEVSARDLEIWFNSEGSDNLPKVRALASRLQKNNLVNAKVAGGTVWEAINTAFTKITGKPIIGNDGKGTKAAFQKDQFGYGTAQGVDYGFVMLEGGKLRVASTELKISGKDVISIDELISMINAFNTDNAGTKQLWQPNNINQYKRSGNVNGINSKNDKGRLVLWSKTKKVESRDVIKGQEVKGDDVAGDVLMTGLGDNYENLQIVVSDNTKVLEIKAKIESHVKQGGTIDSILITSTASNTGLDPKKMSDFSTMMKKQGMGDYVNVSTDKGTTGDFTIDQVDTTDRALAVARGKILAKTLGVESNVTYKFSITDGPKTVDISVKGTSPSTPGEITKIDGSISDEEQITEKSGDVIFPVRVHVKFKKAGIGTTLGNVTGLSQGARRQGKV